MMSGLEPKPTPPRRRDVAWEAMVAACGCDPHLERGRINQALRTLRSHPDYVRVVTNDGWDAADAMLAREIPVRADLYRQRWPTMELTPTALATNWARVVTPIPSRGVTASTLLNLAQEARRREQFGRD